MIGQSLGPYAIEAELGSGGMGTVYRATGPGGTVAVKIVHPLSLPKNPAAPPMIGCYEHDSAQRMHLEARASSP